MLSGFVVTVPGQVAVNGGLGGLTMESWTYILLALSIFFFIAFVIVLLLLIYWK